MKTLVALGLVLSLGGCYGDPEASRTSTNPDFNLHQLFEVDGCKVYRFMDGWQARYFVTCQGRTMHSEFCGKGCERDVEIATAVR